MQYSSNYSVTRFLSTENHNVIAQCPGGFRLNPFPSLRSVATDDSKQFQCLLRYRLKGAVLGNSAKLGNYKMPTDGQN